MIQVWTIIEDEGSQIMEVGLIVLLFFFFLFFFFLFQQISFLDWFGGDREGRDVREVREIQEGNPLQREDIKVSILQF